MKVEVETTIDVKEDSVAQGKRFLTKYGLNSSEAKAKLNEEMLLLATLCNCPVAFVSILHEDFYYIVGQEGIDSTGMPASETLSKYISKAEKTLVIEDTLKHRNFEDNPMVNNSKPIRFYAGVPLTSSEGRRAGVVCVMDYQSKKLNARQLACLEMIANRVHEVMEYHKRSASYFADLESKFAEDGSLNIGQRQELLLQEINALSNKNERLKRQEESLKYALSLLQEKQKELIDMLDAAPGCGSILDTEFKYLFANKKYDEWFGLSRDQLLGKSMEKTIGPEGFAQIQPMLAKVFKGESQQFEYQADTNEGLKTVRVDCTPRTSEGKIEQIYIFAHDVSEMHQVQVQLQNTNDDLKFFSSRASHDLKAPLGIIESFSNVLQNDFSDQLDETGLQYLSFIQESAAQMKRLVTDLFAFARAGRSDGKIPDLLDLNEVLAIVKKNIHLLIEESGAEITVNQTLPAVRVRQSDAVQLLQNLIANSIKYKQADKNPNIEIAYTLDKGNAAITVSDNGIGIEQENLEKVFDPFFRSYHPNINGSGIGLATCQKVVDHYNGKIWITSKVGEGSQFHFTLPTM